MYVYTHIHCEIIKFCVILNIETLQSIFIIPLTPRIFMVLRNKDTLAAGCREE